MYIIPQLGRRLSSQRIQNYNLCLSGWEFDKSKYIDTVSSSFRLIAIAQLLVFSYSVIKPKNRNHSIIKVTNKGYDR